MCSFKSSIPVAWKLYYYNTFNLNLEPVLYFPCKDHSDLGSYPEMIWCIFIMCKIYSLFWPLNQFGVNSTFFSTWPKNKNLSSQPNADLNNPNEKVYVWRVMIQKPKMSITKTHTSSTSAGILKSQHKAYVGNKWVVSQSGYLGFLASGNRTRSPSEGSSIPKNKESF